MYNVLGYHVPGGGGFPQSGEAVETWREITWPSNRETRGSPVVLRAAVFNICTVLLSCRTGLVRQ